MERQSLADYSDKEIWDEARTRLLGNKYQESVTLDCFSDERIRAEASFRGFRQVRNVDDRIKNAVVSKDNISLVEALRDYVYDLTGVFVWKKPD